jgi:hypothetical protein
LAPTRLTIAALVAESAAIGAWARIAFNFSITI